jgi:hypothetical protein
VTILPLSTESSIQMEDREALAHHPQCVPKKVQKASNRRFIYRHNLQTPRRKFF